MEISLIRHRKASVKKTLVLKVKFRKVPYTKFSMRFFYRPRTHPPEHPSELHQHTVPWTCSDPDPLVHPKGSLGPQPGLGSGIGMISSPVSGSVGPGEGEGGASCSNCLTPLLTKPRPRTTLWLWFLGGRGARGFAQPWKQAIQSKKIIPPQKGFTEAFSQNR